jgi:hypothetical protein
MSVVENAKEQLEDGDTVDLVRDVAAVRAA